MSVSRCLDELKKALRRLPGVGPKNAQRMAYHLLERDRDGAREIINALGVALEQITNCIRCNNFSEQQLCSICSSSRRDASILCVVENPADLEMVEQAGVYHGMYFVLMGHFSPLDGVGPDELGIGNFIKVLEEHKIREVILATNLTVEGEATAEFLGDLIRKKKIEVSRLARGLPMGGELEYMDQGTLTQAFNGRRVFD